MDPRMRAASKRAAITPALVTFLASERLRRRPSRAFSLIRRLDPVHRSPIGFWLVSSHADAAAALRNPLLGSDERHADLEALRVGLLTRVVSRGAPPPTSNAFNDLFTAVMLFRDPPDHTRLRALVSKAFTPKRAEAFAPRITELVDEILDRVSRQGSFDVMRDLAYPLPARVICEILGVPDEEHELFVRHAPALATRLDFGPMRSADTAAKAETAILELREYLDDLISTRRLAPGNDLLSALIQAEEGGDRLDHEELVATVLLLLIAGHETTANVIGNGLVALLRHPDQLARLREDPSLERPAVEELLRFEPPAQFVQRISLGPVRIRDEAIPAGRFVIVCLAAANRDPVVFQEPDRLDLSRNPNPHLAFGAGAHFCLGAPLARIEARVALPALARRFPTLRLEAPPTRRPSFVIRGLTALPVTW